MNNQTPVPYWSANRIVGTILTLISLLSVIALVWYDLFTEDILYYSVPISMVAFLFFSLLGMFITTYQDASQRPSRRQQ